MNSKGMAQEDYTATQKPSPVTVAEKPVRLSRRERRKIATRESLIKAAQEVIAVKGVYLAVIEEITERADVAKGSFYQYFHNRDDLLHVLLTRRLEELRVLVAATPPPNTFAKRVQLLLHYHLEYFLRHEDFLFFLHQIRGLVKMRGEETPIVQETYRRYLRFLAEWLQPDNRKRLVNGQTREEGACALLGLLTGFLSHYAILFPLTMLGDEKGRVENALLHACLAFWE